MKKVRNVSINRQFREEQELEVHELSDEKLSQVIGAGGWGGGHRSIRRHFRRAHYGYHGGNSWTGWGGWDGGWNSCCNNCAGWGGLGDCWFTSCCWY
ncbi:MAG TPA: hypothetical protein VL485_27950 [Ktedonobacteraceae bacterium]|jgi:hypothetical protein|nr:hypothetical protein [Ktedonobacteraceae bacterium]